MISKPTPTRPFQELAGDFCYHAGKSYLVLVDCYTDWPTIVPMGSDTSATKLIAAMTELFCRTAIPDTFWSDGGPQFTSKTIPQVFSMMGIPTLYIISLLPPKQREGRSNSQVYEKDHTCFMEWKIPWRRQTLQSPVAVQKHTIGKGWAVTSTETLWTSCPGHHPCSWLVTRFNMAALQRGGQGQGGSNCEEGHKVLRSEGTHTTRH